MPRYEQIPLYVAVRVGVVVVFVALYVLAHIAVSRLAPKWTYRDLPWWVVPAVLILFVLAIYAFAVLSR